MANFTRYSDNTDFLACKGPKMKYFQHKYILLIGSLVFALLYTVLRDTSFGVDAAVCASFTVLVFGYAIRKRGRSLLSGEDARSVAEILLAHTVCLWVVLATLRSAMFASALPDWLVLPIVEDHYGRIGPSALQILEGLALFLTGLMEMHLLASPKVKDPAKEEQRAHKALWKDSELEAERMSRLRFQHKTTTAP